jgi:hypothetical protein
MTTMTESELADFLSITDRQVRRLVESGVLVREPGGDFDAVRCARAYLRSRRDDLEGKRARAESLRVDSVAKMLRMRRQAGQVVTADELRELVDDMWSKVWTTWMLMMSTLYHGLPTTIDDGFRRVLVASLDELGKSELHALRERLDERLAGVRAELVDDERIDCMMRALAGAEGEA